MGAFHFQVDRIHRVLDDLSFRAGLSTGAQALNVVAGSQIVYRGLVEIAGQAHLVFEKDGTKLYTNDVQQVRQRVAVDPDQLPHYA